VPGETDSWDFGVGAGFYVDATEEPWSRHYRMYSYILELRELVLANSGSTRRAAASSATRWAGTAR
jgi:S-formylglutathione hydrolase FrmB